MSIFIARRAPAPAVRDVLIGRELRVAAANKALAAGSVRLTWTSTPSGLRCKWVATPTDSRERGEEQPARRIRHEDPNPGPTAGVPTQEPRSVTP
jgi:hypothetical protein